MAGYLVEKLGFKECREYNLGLWQCPSFLFIIMGLINVGSILTTYVIVQRYDSPELVMISVSGISIFIFSLGTSIIHGIQQMVTINKMRNEFVSIASHQLKAPLSGLRWSCDILMSPKTGELNPKQRDYLNEVQNNITRMVRMVNDLLDVTKIDSGKMKMEMKEVDIVDAAEDVIKELSAFAAANKVELYLCADPGVSKVVTDPTRVRLVLQNFIDNAIKYIGDAEKRRVGIVIRNEDKCVYCGVEDNGIGISEEDQKKIFEKFFRGTEVARRQTVGTGLGLYIAKAAIEASKGKVGFNSEFGKGSEFWFRLPRLDIMEGK